MPKYAVKLGEIHLHSVRPITEEERKQAIKLLDSRKIAEALLMSDYSVVVLSVDRH